MDRTPPLISYVNVLADATLTVSAETFDGFGLNAVNGLTYDYWVPGGSANIEFQLASAKEVECFGVAAHNLSSFGSSIFLDYWDGSQWVQVSRPAIATTDITIFELLDNPVTSDLFRVRVNGAASIGVLWAGPVLRMQRNIYQGHTPVVFSERNEQRANQTETGEWRGVASTIKGAELSAKFDNLTSAWVRSDLAPLITHVNEGNPFFWAWHIDRYNKDVAYCWLSGGEWSVSNSGPRDLMSINMQASAYLDGPQPVPPVVTSTLYPVYSLENGKALGVQNNQTDLRTILKRTNLEEIAKATGPSIASVNLRAVTKTITPNETAQATGSTVDSVNLRQAVKLTSTNETAQATGSQVTSVTLVRTVIVYDEEIETAQATGATVTGATLT